MNNVYAGSKKSIHLQESITITNHELWDEIRETIMVDMREIECGQ